MTGRQGIVQPDSRVPEAVRTAGERLVETAAALGWFTAGPIARTDRSAVLSAARKWLERTEAAIDTFTAADALTVIEIYDPVHRIAHNTAADPRYIHRYVNAALEARIHGDHSVDPYRLFRMIHRGLTAAFKLYSDRPLEWKSRMLDRWHREFRTGTYTGPEPIDDYDRQNRIAILLDTDLWTFEPDPQAFKSRLRAASTPC